MSGDRLPACHDAISHSNYYGWELPTPADVQALDPCSYCFPDGNIDTKLSLLTIATNDPEHVHRIESTGPIDYDAVHGDDWNPNEMRNRLLAMDADEVLGGERA